MKRCKIFASLSTVSNNEITIKSDEEMAAKTSVSPHSSLLGRFAQNVPGGEERGCFRGLRDGNMQLTSDFTVTCILSNMH